MRCQACAAQVSRWSPSPLCPACYAATGATLPTPIARPADVLWRWTSPTARAALATGNLGTILRAYRAATATSQRQLAERLGYDTTYISMIETGRRDITDVAALTRIAHQLGIPAHTLGVAEPDDADFVSMLQFAESTLRLAVLARQSGHGTEAVNELWPVAARLEARIAAGHTERDVLHLLARVRAELGVCLGYVLPEQHLPTAARWTWRALAVAANLDDPHLHAHALRVHGNELRKIGHLPAAVVRLYQALDRSEGPERAAVLMQLARAIGEQGTPEEFDLVIHQAETMNETSGLGGLTSQFALYETQIRGLTQTHRPAQARRLIHSDRPIGAEAPAQWRTMINITVAQVLLTTGDTDAAESTLVQAVRDAETHRLPHQIQRAARCADTTLPNIREQCSTALRRLTSAGHADNPTTIDPM